MRPGETSLGANKLEEAALGPQGQLDLYVPKPAQIRQVRELTVTERLFRIRLSDGSSLAHKPGQFVEISLAGVGEAPISICSAELPSSPDFELCIRKIGSLTSKLHGLAGGASVGIRGPCGHGFDLELLRGQDVLFIAGGIGLPPVRSLIQHCLANREEFGRLTLLHGARSPEELLFTEDLASWQKCPHLEVHVTVDRGDDRWQGNVGPVTTLITPLRIEPGKTIAAVVGPPVMYKFVIAELAAKDLPAERIMVSLERKMRCGVGKCGHCTIGDFYCCIDGPVFLYNQIKDIPGAI